MLFTTGRMYFDPRVGHSLAKYLIERDLGMKGRVLPGQTSFTGTFVIIATSVLVTSDSEMYSVTFCCADVNRNSCIVSQKNVAGSLNPANPRSLKCGHLTKARRDCRAWGGRVNLSFQVPKTISKEWRLGWLLINGRRCST